MKRFVFYLLVFLFANLYGQSVSIKKCKTCGMSLSQCQYKGRHPAQNVEKNTNNQSLPKKREVSFGSNSNNAIIKIDGLEKEWSINDHIVLSDGTHHVAVSASGYCSYYGTINVDSRKTYFYFPLKLQTISISGVVSDSSGNPITGIIIWTTLSQKSIIVDDQGHFQLDDVIPNEDIEIFVDGKKYTQKAKEYIAFIIESEKTIRSNSAIKSNNIIDVNGLVLSKRGEPIIGARIQVKGSNKVAISDIDGKFMIEVPEYSELIVSWPGMKTQTLQAQPTMRIVLRKK